MIRVATHEDIPALVSLGEMLHNESSYARLSYNRGKVFDLMGRVIDGAGVIFVSVKNGEVVGGIAGAVTEHWFSDEKLAFDYSFFVAPKHRHGITAMKLLCAFCEWAKLKGATEIRLGITTAINVEGTAKLYRSMGFEDAGLLFRKEVSHGC
ncbi:MULTISPECIES: GNAT family N-acetyltransferase [unclassified Serratia (in: enterobacteria)]|uniref:GNAT family N-acetyltransferase n=1 Tax=unclassified Serratia (in: enterobacteria) TaxID=2647522 RepID=UPI003075FDAE